MKITDYFDVERKEQDDSYCDEIILKDKKTGEVVFSWYDNAHIDYPEDLSWSRMISDIFLNAFELGYKMGQEK